MKFTLRYSLFLSLLLMLAASGRSQTCEGIIALNVVDAAGAAKPEATVKPLNDPNGFARETVSAPRLGFGEPRNSQLALKLIW